MILGFSLNAQYVLTGRIEAYPNRDLNICSQFGDESKLLATIKTDFSGAFTYSLKDHVKGLYRIYLDTEDSFDLVFYDEDIDLITKIENPQYNMQIIKSEQNQQLYSYLIENYILDYKIDVLKQLEEIYPDGKFLKKVQKELKNEIDNKNNNLEKVIRQNPNSFTGRYLSFFKEISIPEKFNEYEKIQFLKSNYLKSFKMSDVELINSNAYNNVVIAYFKLYKGNNPDIYYDAGKAILEHIRGEDSKIFNFVFEYILTGFESLSLDEVSAKLSLEYGNVCSDGDESLKLRIKSNTLLSVGKKAPDFSIKTISGKDYTLSNMSSEYTLIIFWATWCEHCKVILPRLATATNIFKEAKMDVIAVSVDSDEAVLKKYLVDNLLPWEVICQFKGWDGSIAIDYAVFATPYMIIVDKDLNIVAKPFNEDRLYIELEKILTNN